MSMKINVSLGKANYSQRNNLRVPHNACSVTGMVMPISYLGYKFPDGKYDQPEDNLHYHISCNHDCIKYYNDFVARNTWARGIPPEQIHEVLSWCTNHWMKKQITNFSANRPMEAIFEEIKNGRAIVMSGDFPFINSRGVKTTLGHIVVLVGAEWNNSLGTGNPRSIIIDDPYGNTLNNFQGSGNDVVLSWDQFIRWFKPLNNISFKWGHFFKKPTER